MSNPLDEALAAMDERLDNEEASPEETPSTQEERPRDEQGRFTTEPEQTEEAEPETEETETAEEAAERLLAGKYRSPEDLENAYKELESRFGSQGAELAEYRRAYEQQQQAPTPIDQPTADWFAEQVERNPYGAAEWARQNDRSGVLYEQAMESWYLENPRQAAAYERQLEFGQLRQEFDQRLQQTAQPITEQEMARAFKAATDRHADVRENLGELLESAVRNSPVATRTLMAEAQTGDYETKVQVFDAIISLAKGQHAGAVAQRVQGAADEDAARARQMKQSGGVATQSQAVQAETVSPDEQWLRDNFDKYLDPAE